MTSIEARPANIVRTLLVLGRVSNLPTVWSNCLAGWLLGAGGNTADFVVLCAGATCVYVGGMFLNDAIDAGFDARFRQERPIPSGAIELKAVWWSSGALLVVGTLLLASLGPTAAPLALLLLASVVVYDLVHKTVPFSPLIMAACRAFLYLVAGAASEEGIEGITVWGAAVMGSYVVGLSYLARGESTEGPLRYWPCVLLAMPVVLASIINDGEHRSNSVWLSALLALWVVRCLRWTFFSEQKNVGHTVSGLLAGIILVDLLMVLPRPYPEGLVFLALLGLALLFQRFVPAT